MRPAVLAIVGVCLVDAAGAQSRLSGQALELNKTFGGARVAGPSRFPSGPPVAPEFKTAVRPVGDLGPILRSAAAAGVPVYLPCGTYAIDTPAAFIASSTVAVTGLSPQCVTINVTFAAGDVFTFTKAQHVRFSNVTINAPKQRTSGAIFDLVGTYDADFDEVFVTGLHAKDAWLLNNAITTRITKFECRPPIAADRVGKSAGAGACIHMTGSGSAQSLDLYFDQGSSDSWTYGFEMSNGSGLYGTNTDFVRSGQGVFFNPSSSNTLPSFGFMFSNVDADTSFGDNWAFSGTGILDDTQITNAEASNSQEGNGFCVTNPALDQLQVTNLDALGNYGSGVSVLAGAHMTFTNTSAMMDGRKNSLVVPNPQVPDILVGPDADYVSFMGGRTGPGGAFLDVVKTTPSASYGFKATGKSANGQHVTVIGLQGKPGTLGALYNGLTSPKDHPVFANNY